MDKEAINNLEDWSLDGYSSDTLLSGKHRYGWPYRCFHVACAQETSDVYIHNQPSNHKSLAAACVK